MNLMRKQAKARQGRLRKLSSSFHFKLGSPDSKFSLSKESNSKGQRLRLDRYEVKKILYEVQQKFKVLIILRYEQSSQLYPCRTCASFFHYGTRAFFAK